MRPQPTPAVSRRGDPCLYLDARALLAAIIGYVLGAIPTGIPRLGRLLKNIDIRRARLAFDRRHQRSMRTLGPWPALAVLIIDIREGLPANVLIDRLALPRHGGRAAHQASSSRVDGIGGHAVGRLQLAGQSRLLIGHGRSIWLRFTGGIFSAATGLSVLLAIVLAGRARRRHRLRRGAGAVAHRLPELDAGGHDRRRARSRPLPAARPIMLLSAKPVAAYVVARHRANITPALMAAYRAPPRSAAAFSTGRSGWRGPMRILSLNDLGRPAVAGTGGLSRRWRHRHSLPAGDGRTPSATDADCSSTIATAPTCLPQRANLFRDIAALLARPRRHLLPGGAGRSLGRQSMALPSALGLGDLRPPRTCPSSARRRASCTSASRRTAMASTRSSRNAHVVRVYDAARDSERHRRTICTALLRPRRQGGHARAPRAGRAPSPR